MYFKKMSMHGFKSFADPISMEFDRGITCVVGPNGSGKSNVSDALRWVLGEQSPKMLRGGKMEEVIFAGTDARKSRGMAEVSLLIDNTDHSLPIDFQEVKITRRMFRSGEMEYLINDTPCRLKDIRELIMDTGIGVDGYSIIGQGKISEIINGKPENRREMFEEAAGIVKYRSRKAEAERKLAATSGNLERVTDIISELSARVEPLREESIRAEKYQELAEQYRVNEINVTLKNIEQSDEQVRLLKKDCMDLEHSIAEKEHLGGELQKQIQEKQTEQERLEQQEQKLSEEQLQFRVQLEEMKNRIHVDQEKIESVKSGRRMLQEERLRIEEKRKREETELEKLKQQAEEISRRLEAVTAENRNLSDKYSHADRMHREHAAQFEADRDRLYELTLLVTSKDSEMNSLKNLRRTLEEQKKLQLGNRESDERHGYLENRIAEEKKGKKDCSGQLEQARLRCGMLQTKKEQQEQLRFSAEEKYQIACSRRNEARTKKDMLEQLEKTYEGYQYPVRFILNESGVSGLYGAVGALVQVPSGMEIAVDTALGARVQNIVCKDDDSAGAAIRVLKERKAGRLTFLPVESLRVTPRKKPDGLDTERGFLGIAADCVDFEEKFRKVFEYLLGGIVIMETLEDALRIQKKYSGYHYVTRGGEYVNPSGAITGGTKKHNQSGILERKNRLNAVERQLYDLEQSIHKLEGEKATAEEEAKQLEAQLRESEKACRKLEIEEINRTNVISALEQQLKELSIQEERGQREIDLLETELFNNQSLLRKLEQEKAEAEEQLEHLKKSAESLASENEGSRKMLQELTETLTEQRIQMEALRREQTGVQNARESCQKRIQEYQSESEAREASEREAAEQQLQLEKTVEENRLLLQKYENEHNDDHMQVEKLRQQKKLIFGEIEKQRGERESLDKEIFTLRTSHYEMESKRNAAETRIENWKNSLWDSFEISYLQALDSRKRVFDLNDGLKESRRLKYALRELGEVNLGAIREYKEVSERYEFLTAQKQDLDAAIETLQEIIKETDLRIRTAFQSSFSKIRKHFAEVFHELFEGGTAELRIPEGEDPLEAEIEIVVQPPGKRLQNMNLLSGGEKTMTAIALMFAILKTKPTPFCILDEVEAALDEANIVRFAKYLEGFAESGIQFVLVTHQKVTMEHAHVLYGVTMPEKGISKILSLKLTDAVQLDGGK